VKKLALVAAAAIVSIVPGAAARSTGGLRLLSAGPLVISPNGNGVNDSLRLHVATDAGSELGLRAYLWEGRLSGWRRVPTGVTVHATGPETTVAWGATGAGGRTLGDGSYVVTLCDKDAGKLLPPLVPPAEQRPGDAEASVDQPPWRRTGCLAKPRIVRVERLAAYVDSTSSYAPGARVPLQVSADEGRASVVLERDCSGQQLPLGPGRLPDHLQSGLYHFLVRDPWGDEFRAPVAIRNGSFPLDRPPPRTVLLVWPYLSWRAYNAYDANLDGRLDSWYQFWHQRRVSLIGPVLRNGVEDDHVAVLPFSRWLCAHPGLRVQSITDVELGRMPLRTLRRYAGVMFPGHSEYYVPATHDLLRRYRDGGGHLAFLLANPFYRQVRVDRSRNAVVMTDYDAREGPRTDFSIAGVGYDGCCFLRSHTQKLVAARGSDYARVRWLFRGTGIGPGDRFGSAGSESDRIDPAIPPRDHVVAGEAIIQGNHGVVNSAMVWTPAGRGFVFATGNYDFLRMRGRTPSGERLPWALLDNIWRKLAG